MIINWLDASLGRLIGKGTGESLFAYCRRVLFDPLGFGPVAIWSLFQTPSAPSS